MRSRWRRLMREGYLRGTGIVLFALSIAVVATQWGRLHRRLDSIYSTRPTFWRVMTSTFRMLIRRGRRGAAFNSFSLPLSSRCSGWADSVYDANLALHWHDGKENPVRRLSWHNRFIYFYANLVSRAGFIALAWVIFYYQANNKDKRMRFLALLSKLDIAILLKGWNEQLESFYQSNIWFDPDSIDGFSDSLSKLIEEIRKVVAVQLAQEAKELFPDSSLIEELYGEFLEGGFNLEEALQYYARAAAYNPANGLARLRYKNLMSLLSNIKTKEFEAATISDAKTICEKVGGTFVQAGESENLKYSYMIFIGDTEHKHDIELTFSPYGVARLHGVLSLGGGLLASEKNEKKYVLGDTKHLDIRHLKLFSPLVIAHDQYRALIKVSPISELIEVDKAFVFPGMGWNYYHWLYETLPYMMDYEKFSNDGNIPAAFMFPLKKWHLEALATIGHGALNVVPFFPGNCYYYSDCFIPTHCSRDLVPSPSAIRFIRQKLARPRAIRRGKKVFLSRRGVQAVRGMRNFSQVEGLFIEKGFNVVDPSKMSFQQQIDFFSDVEILAAEGGAALANMVFCPEQTKVIVLSGERAWAETFTVISGVIGQEVNAILGESMPYPNSYYLWTAFDYLGNMNGIKIALERL